jgi:alanine racemase
MDLNRRTFLGAVAVAAASPLVGPAAARASALGPVAPRVPGIGGTAGSDPWLEVDRGALAANARALSLATGGRPVFACVKNNGYGVGLERVAPALDVAPEVVGLAVVKVDEAMRLTELGLRKPILLMAHPTDAEAWELGRRGVHLAPFHDSDVRRIADLGRRLQRPVPVHLYVDTGMSRMGIPYHRALPWAVEMAALPEARVESAFTGLTEDHQFDREQVRRLRELAVGVRARGPGVGLLHAASSDAIVHVPESYLDMVRPGLALFGAYPDSSRGGGRLDLTPAFRLRAPVVRVERLRPGDTVSYGRTYVAREPVWVATIPVGHTDGYPRQATQGCRILVGARTYPVIGFVSASHCIVEVGSEPTVAVGDTATLIGPDHPDVHPNEVADRSDRSVYDVLMHLAAWLPERPWSGPA